MRNVSQEQHITTSNTTNIGTAKEVRNMIPWLYRQAKRENETKKERKGYSLMF